LICKTGDVSFVLLNRKEEGGLTKDSVIQREQFRTIDKRRITRKLGSVNSNCLQKVEEAIKIRLAFGEYTF